MSALFIDNSKGVSGVNKLPLLVLHHSAMHVHLHASGLKNSFSLLSYMVQALARTNGKWQHWTTPKSKSAGVCDHMLYIDSLGCSYVSRTKSLGIWIERSSVFLCFWFPLFSF